MFGGFTILGLWRWTGESAHTHPLENPPLLPVGSPPQFTDVDVISKLEKAVDKENSAEVEQCLQYITTYSADDIQTTLQRFFHFYKELHWQSTQGFRKNLLEALYPVLKAQANLQPVIESFLAAEKCYQDFQCEIFVDLFFDKQDRACCLMMIDIMNKLKIASDRDIRIKYLPLFAEFCRAQEIDLMTKCFEMLSCQPTDRTVIFGSIYDAMSGLRKRPEFPRLMADWLHGAFITKNSKLLFECFEELSCHWQCRNARNGDPEIFEKIYQHRPLEGIEDWSAALIVQLIATVGENDHPTSNKIRHALIFLTKIPVVKSRMQFAHVFDAAMQGCTYEAKRASVIYLMRCTSHMEEKNEETILRVLGLVNQFRLHRDPEVRKVFVYLLAKEHYSSSRYTDNWLVFVQNFFPSIDNENPVVAMVREYLVDLPKENHETIIKLLSFAIGIDAPVIVDSVLRACSVYNMQHLLIEEPNCTKLLQEGDTEPIKYVDNVRIPIPETRACFWLPRVILEARAPNFMEGLKSSHWPSDVIIAMLRFLSHPYWPDDPFPLSLLAGMYRFAGRIGAERFIHCAKNHVVTEKKEIRPEEVTPLLEMFSVAKGEFKQDLKHILLAQGCLLHKTDPEGAKKITARMRAVGALVFQAVDVYQVFGRFVGPKGFHKNPKCGERYEIGASFIRILQELAPEIEELDLHETVPIAGVFHELGIQFPGLKKLSVNFRRNDPHLVEEMTALKIQALELYSPGWCVFEHFSKLPPLRSLVIYDFDYANLFLEKLLKAGNAPPLFFRTLQAFELKLERGFLSSTLSPKEVEALVRLMPALKKLTLNACKVTDDVLKCVQLHLSDVHSFAAGISVVENVTYDQFHEFCKANRGMQDLCLRVYPINGPETDAMRIVGALHLLEKLQSLHLQYFLDTASLAKLVEGHRDLVTLNISYSEKITDESIPSLIQLRHLRELDVCGTKLTSAGIIRLAESLPNLRILKIQLCKSRNSDRDARIIMYKLALKGIEVKIVGSDPI